MCQDGDYISLGGLVHATKNILQIVEAVRAKVPSSMRIHLFGIARPAAVPDMVKAGVTSIDSASHLRRAWLGAGQNYFTEGRVTLYESLRLTSPLGQAHG